MLTIPRPDKKGPLPPLVYVAKVVLDRRCGLSSGARLVALAVAKRMNVPPADGEHQSFPGVRSIAADTSLSPRTVRSKLAELKALEEPLFKIRLGGSTQGRVHRSYEFTLVRVAERAQVETTARPGRFPGATS